ncbi:hypothetical protein [Vibrio furnissii]|uniref:hypothetical protein n=1 Tax=Vibrio furnissii TaxID=29494 RepID=UPI00375105ED
MQYKQYVKISIYLSFFLYVCLATVNVIYNVSGFNYIVVVCLSVLFLLGIGLYNKVNFFTLIFSMVSLTFGIGAYLSSSIETGAQFQFFYLLLVSTIIGLLILSRLKRDEVIKITVITFYIYLLFSVFTFFLFKSYYRAFTFDGAFLDRAFHGIEGSPANIDTFSTLFMVCVLFSNYKLIEKIIHTTVFLLVVYFCDTQTPFLIFLTILGFYIANKFLKNKSRRLIIFGIYAVMILIFYLSITNESIHEFLLLATNGRNNIWDQQIDNVFSDFGLVDFVFGDFRNAYVSIHWSNEDTNNPHNGYLFILIRLGLFSTVLFLLYVWIVSKKISNFQYYILISLLAASVSNSNVFYLSNPMITLLLIYSISPRLERDNEKCIDVLR